MRACWHGSRLIASTTPSIWCGATVVRSSTVPSRTGRNAGSPPSVTPGATCSGSHRTEPSSSATPPPARLPLFRSFVHDIRLSSTLRGRRHYRALKAGRLPRRERRSDPIRPSKEQESRMIDRHPRRGGPAVRAAGEVGLLVSVVAGLIVAAGAAPALAGVPPQTGPSGALALAQAIAAPST